MNETIVLTTREAAARAGSPEPTPEEATALWERAPAEQRKTARRRMAALHHSDALCAAREFSRTDADRETAAEFGVSAKTVGAWRGKVRAPHTPEEATALWERATAEQRKTARRRMAAVFRSDALCAAREFSRTDADRETAAEFGVSADAVRYWRGKVRRAARGHELAALIDRRWASLPLRQAGEEG